VYKFLKATIDGYEGRISLISFINSLNEDNIAYSVQDAISVNRIANLDYIQLQTKSHNFIPLLKGIENGAGIVLFVLSILFLVAEIVYLVFACGIRETQLASNSAFCVFNILKIITYTLAITCIFYSAAYGVVLIIILVQYMALVVNIDSCSIGIVYGIVYAYYSFWAYITLSCIFGKERELYKAVGSVANPGVGAFFDISGNSIARPPVTTQVVVIPQVVAQPLNSPYQNLGNINQEGNNTFIPQQPVQVGSSGRNMNKAQLDNKKK
jgi:hypothetical protein